MGPLEETYKDQVQIYIGDKLFKCLFDTGVDQTIIREEEVLKEWKPTLPLNQLHKPLRANQLHPWLHISSEEKHSLYDCPRGPYRALYAV